MKQSSSIQAGTDASFNVATTSDEKAAIFNKKTFFGRLLNHTQFHFEKKKAKFFEQRFSDVLGKIFFILNSFGIFLKRNF